MEHVEYAPPKRRLISVLQPIFKPIMVAFVLNIAQYPSYYFSGYFRFTVINVLSSVQSLQPPN